MPARSRFTPALTRRIVEHCRSGLFRYNACALEGVGVRTVERWIANGRDNLATREHEEEDPEHVGPLTRISPFGRFVLQLDAAEAQAEAKILGVIHKLASACKDPAVKLRAGQWYLERKNNLRYGRGALRVTGSGDENTDADAAEDVVAIVVGKLSQIERRITPAGSPDGSARE